MWAIVTGIAETEWVANTFTGDKILGSPLPE